MWSTITAGKVKQRLEESLTKRFALRSDETESLDAFTMTHDGRLY